MRYALGFRQKPDGRDTFYPLEKIMGVERENAISKNWLPGPVLNQGPTSSCVGHACFQLQVSEPVVLLPPRLGPFDIYGEARKIDEWQDNDDVDGGTSVRAGLNVLRNHGIIDSYYWAQDAEQCLEFILKFGPLVFGTSWTTGMFDPDPNGYVVPIGSLAGGHAYFGYRADLAKREIIFRNSWDVTYGQGGDFRMRLEDVQDLMEDGGCAAAVREIQP